MRELVVCAIAIDAVRDMFRAPPELAERLRGVAAQRLARPAPTRRWFNPLMRRDPATEVDASRPLRTDVDVLLTGGFVAPDRLPQSWELLTAWIEESAAASRRVRWDRDEFDRVEWNLACAGLSSDYALRSLADRQLGVPLRPLPGQVVGYAKHVHAVEMAETLEVVLENPEVGDEAKAFVAPLLEVLRAAAAEDRLDVVVVGTA